MSEKKEMYWSFLVSNQFRINIHNKNSDFNISMILTPEEVRGIKKKFDEIDQFINEYIEEVAE